MNWARPLQIAQGWNSRALSPQGMSSPESSGSILHDAYSYPIDKIIYHLHADRDALKASAVVSHSFLHENFERLSSKSWWGPWGIEINSFLSPSRKHWSRIHPSYVMERATSFNYLWTIAVRRPCSPFCNFISDVIKLSYQRLTLLNTFKQHSNFPAVHFFLQSRGQDTLRLLQDFDDNLFTNHPSVHLRQED